MGTRSNRGLAKRTSLGGVLVLGLALAAPALATEAPPPPAPPPPAVATITVAKHPVTAQSGFTGRIEAIDRVELRARIDGYLQERAFTEGALVTKGDLLFVIEKAPYLAAQREAEGAVLRARGTLARAESDLARQKELVARQAAAQSRLEDAQASVIQSKGDLMSAEAALERASLNLAYTEVRAPIAGKIGKSAFSVGGYVAPASGALATVVSEDPIYVTFPVSQRDLLDVRREAARKTGPGDGSDVVVKLKLADGSLYGETGRVNFLDVQSDPTTDSVLVRAQIANPQRFLVDRQIVTVIVAAAKPEMVLVIPQRAQQIDQAGAFVLVVDKDQTAQPRRIVTAPAGPGTVVVTQGLAEGDRVIVDGIQKVRPGVKVDAADIPFNAAPLNQTKAGG